VSQLAVRREASLEKSILNFFHRFGCSRCNLERGTILIWNKNNNALRKWGEALYYTLGVIDGYVTVDTSNITYNGKGAIINEAENTLTIPAGFTNGMVLHALHTLAPRNAALSVGNAGSVGYIGYTIVGGLGYATPMVGMSCDALVEIEMVLFDGRIVTANKTHNSELLWASCGSYAGLGIITEMTVKYRLLETELFSYGRVHFSRQPTISRQAEMVSQILGHFSSPSNVVYGGGAFLHRDSFDLHGLFAKSLDGVKDMMKELGFDKYVKEYALDDTSSFAQASISFVCDTLLSLSLGRPDVLQSELLEPLSSIVERNVSTLLSEAKQSRLCNQSEVLDALLSMSESRSSSINWSLNPVWAPTGNTSNLAVPRQFGKHRFTPNLSPQDMERLLQVLPGRMKIIRLNSGVVSEIPKDGSAFAWRESPILMRIVEYSAWNDDLNSEVTPNKVANGSMTNTIMGIIQNAHPGRIGSYLGLPDHATSNWQHSFYGSNYVRLARLRAKYDPLDTFGKLLAAGQLFDNEGNSDTTTEPKKNSAASQFYSLWFTSLSLMFAT
jgi:hypothetical protein